MNIIPGLSQLKSLVQAACGDTRGAKETQIQFLKRCPVVSQVTSAVQAIAGDEEGARKTQMQFFSTVSDFMDGVPVVGHIKGTVHYACGDTDGGDKAMKSSSRTIGVLGGGAAGFFVGGPVGAVAGGIAGGAGMDAITTGIDSAVHDEYRPAGNIALISNLVDGKSKSASGDVCDLVFGVTMDGVAGRAGGQIANKVIDRIDNQRVYRVMPKKHAIEAVEQQKLPDTPNPQGETWTSESIHRHQRSYLADKIEGNPANEYSTVQIKIRKSDYKTIRAEAIDQKGSGALNKQLLSEGKTPKNLLNNERLSQHPHGKLNLGIKGKANLDSFNSKIIEVREMNSNSMQYDNTFTKQVGTYGRPAATGIAVETYLDGDLSEDSESDYE